MTARDLHEEWRRFRAAYPSTGRRIADAPWEYIVCGRGDEALLLLPGAPGRGATSFQTILAFECDFRVIAPSYPAHLATVAQLVEGLAAILAAEGIRHAHVVGGSYSGLVAQCLVRRCPDLVQTLILSNTGVPKPGRARACGALLRLLPLLPFPLVRAGLRLGARLFVGRMPAGRAFWRAHFGELIAACTREDCASRLRVWRDCDRNAAFARDDLPGWRGEVLILEAAGDAVFAAAERAALRALYPRARVHTFAGGGHAAMLARQDEEIAAIACFLRAGARPVGAPR